MPHVQTQTVTLTATCLEGLATNTAQCRRSHFKAFAKFLKAASKIASESMDDALLYLIRRGHDEAQRLLDDFRTSELARGCSPRVAHVYASTLRKAVRKAREAGKTELNIDAKPGYPPAHYDPAGLVAIALAGFSDATKRSYLWAFKAFAKFLKAEAKIASESREDALLYLIGHGQVSAERLRDDFRTSERALGRSPMVADVHVSMLRTAVRKAREAGKTKFDIDGPYWPNVIIRHNVLFVRGKPHCLRNAQQRAVIEALVNAGRKGMTLPELQRIRPSAAGILKRLRDNDRVLGPFINMAGKKGEPYRIS